MNLSINNIKYSNTTFIEFYSIRGSDSISIVDWIMQNFSNEETEIETIIEDDANLDLKITKIGNVYHFNEVSSSWLVDRLPYLKGLIDGFVVQGAKLIIISYYDYLPNVSLAFTKPDLFHMLKDSIKIYLIRDVEPIFKNRFAKSKELLKNNYSTKIVHSLYKCDDSIVIMWQDSINKIKDNVLKFKYEKIINSNIYRKEIADKLNFSNSNKIDLVKGIAPNDSIKLNRQITPHIEYYTTILARRKEGYIKTNENAISILLLGDSHAEAISGYTGEDFYVDRFTCHGSTARACLRSDSKTKAFRIFKYGIENTNSDAVVISLGEVDCGYVIWLKHQTSGIPINDLFNESISNFMDLIKLHIFQKFNPNKTFVMTIPPAFIVTNTDNRFLGGERSLVDPTLEERKSLIKKWNQRIVEESKKLKFNVLDINDKIINKSNGEIIAKYKTPNEFNHHLWPYTTAPLFIDEIRNKLA